MLTGTITGVTNAISRERRSNSEFRAVRSRMFLTGITFRYGLCPSSACGSTDRSASPESKMIVSNIASVLAGHRDDGAGVLNAFLLLLPAVLPRVARAAPEMSGNKNPQR